MMRWIQTGFYAVLMLFSVEGGVLAATDWPNVHGGLEGWHYSRLDELTPTTVRRLKQAWEFQAEEMDAAGLGRPVASGGVVAVCVGRDRLIALDGVTGRSKWQIRLASGGQACGGLAVDQGILVVAGQGGALAAYKWLDGSSLWSSRLSPRETTDPPDLGTPIIVGDRVIVGTEPRIGGLGELISVDLKSGAEAWRTRVVPPQESRLQGVTTAYPGSYDAKRGLLYWGTGSPWPLFDGAGPDFMTRGQRPGLNDYSAGVLALDVATGERRAWRQEVAHEGWILDSAASQILVLPQERQNRVVHINRIGAVYALTPDLRLDNAWLGIKHFTFATRLDPRTGEFSGRRDMGGQPMTQVCPAVDGGFPGYAGAYSPKTRLLYVVGAEWCMEVKVQSGRLDRFGADITPGAPPNEHARGHLAGRDPVTGVKRWSLDLPEPPLAGVLATEGNLVFVGDTRGRLLAVEALTGKRVWSDLEAPKNLNALVTFEAGGHQILLVSSGVRRTSPFFDRVFGGAPGDAPTGGVIRAYRLP